MYSERTVVIYFLKTIFIGFTLYFREFLLMFFFVTPCIWGLKNVKYFGKGKSANESRLGG